MNVEGVGDAARELLESHAWPGNVRELRNVIERAVIVARSGLDRAAASAAVSAGVRAGGRNRR